jgi:hypothetical protein
MESESLINDTEQSGRGFGAPVDPWRQFGCHLAPDHKRAKARGPPRSVHSDDRALEIGASFSIRRCTSMRPPGPDSAPHFTASVASPAAETPAASAHDAANVKIDQRLLTAFCLGIVRPNACRQRQIAGDHRL